MRIAIVGAAQQSNATYRSFLPCVALEDRGHPLTVLRGNELEIVHQVRRGRFDVAQIYRNYSKQAERVTRALREQGTAVVWDNDDELTDCPSDAYLQRRRGGMRAQKAEAGMRRMCGLADVVTTTSPVLADAYRRYGAAHVRTIENYVPVDFVQVPPVEHAGVVVGWVAGGEHEYDFRQLGLREVLRRLIDEHPDVTVMSIGVDLALDRDRYLHHAHVHFTTLHRAVAAFDVGIAPLHDMPFNRARSNVKLKEYAGAGVPWLASPVGPYLGLGEREGGRIVPDDRWYEELSALVRDQRARRKLARAARRWAATQTVDANAWRWEEAFQEAVEVARRRGAGAVDGSAVRV